MLAERLTSSFVSFSIWYTPVYINVNTVASCLHRCNVVLRYLTGSWIQCFCLTVLTWLMSFKLSVYLKVFSVVLQEEREVFWFLFYKMWPDAFFIWHFTYKSYILWYTFECGENVHCYLKQYNSVRVCHHFLKTDILWHCFTGVSVQLKLQLLWLRKTLKFNFCSVKVQNISTAYTSGVDFCLFCSCSLLT